MQKVRLRPLQTPQSAGEGTPLPRSHPTRRLDLELVPPHSLWLCYCIADIRSRQAQINTGRSPGHVVGMAGCGHSKIARVRAYYLYCMCLAVLSSLQILTVTKY